MSWSREELQHHHRQVQLIDADRQRIAAEVITDELLRTHAIIERSLPSTHELQLFVCPYCADLHMLGADCPSCGAPARPAAPPVDTP